MRRFSLWLLVLAVIFCLAEFSPVPKYAVGKPLQSVIFPGPGGVAGPAVTWAHANGAGIGTNAASVVVTLGFTPAPGSLLIVDGGCYGGYTLAISDDSSGPADSWTNIVPLLSSGNQNLTAWATSVTAGTAPTTVTVSGCLGWPINVTVDNYTGGPNPFSLDGSVATATGSSVNPTVSFTTGSLAGDLLWSAMICHGSSSAPTVVTFTIRQTPYNGPYGTYYIASSDDGISGSLLTGTQYTSEYTLDSSRGWVAAIVGFKVH